MKVHGLLATAAAAAIIAGVLPALAGDGNGRTQAAREVAERSALPQTAEAPEVAARPDARPDARPEPDRPQRRPEQLRLDCNPLSDGDRRGIGCRWSQSSRPDFAAYVLWRGDGEQRDVVFRTVDRSHTRFLDTEVRAGTTYGYAVHVVDSRGRVIGTGGPDHAKIAGRHERLRLECEWEARPAIGCVWSRSEHPDFAGYVLRRGDGSERTVVFRTRDRSHTRYLDTAVQPQASYAYLVEVVDAQGEVIGSGGPVNVPAPRNRVADTRDDRTTR